MPRGHSFNKSNKEERVIKTDSLGIVELNLESAKYTVREVFKNKPFSEFYQQNSLAKSKQKYFATKDKECYKKWWQKNLIDFEIKDTTSILYLEAIIPMRCFVGKNPCLIYRGPMPQ